MSSILQAIEDDIKDYLKKCVEVGETPVWSDGSPDCYGEHAVKVKRLLEDK